MAASVAQIIEEERFALEGRTVIESQSKQDGYESLGLTKTKIDSIYALFDSDDTGAIPSADLDLIFRSLAIELEETELKEYQEKAASEADEKGCLSYDKCTEYIKAIADKKSDAEARAFSDLCGGADAITFESLKAQLQQVEARITDEEIREVISYSDINGDGKVGQDDLTALLRFMDQLSVTNNRKLGAQVEQEEKKQREEEKKAEEEAAAKRKAEEEAAAQAAEEEAAKKKAEEEEAAAKKQAEEEEAKKKQAEEEEAAAKKAEEEAAAKKAEEEEAAAKKQAEEEEPAATANETADEERQAEPKPEQEEQKTDEEPEGEVTEEKEESKAASTVEEEVKDETADAKDE